MNQTKKILIIDDEPSLLKILGKFLEKLNFKPETASSGEEGLNKYLSNPEDYYAVILDYNLPGSSSKEILNKIKKKNPNVKSVLSTGFAVDEISKKFDVKIDATLQKPFTFSDFQQMITNL